MTGLVRLRDYQDGAITALLDHWQDGGGNAVIDMATGLGKSVVNAKLTMDLAKAYPAMRVLLLVDNQELVEQNYGALIRMWPQAPAGIYSAGLGRRDAHHRITFGSIQSVFKRARDLGPRHLVIVDEAHMIPMEGEGMYRRLLSDLADLCPDMRVGGRTATPFRMKGGSLVGSDGAIFERVVYSYGIGQGIDDGWLSPRVSRRGAAGSEINVKGVGRQGGEFKPEGLAAAVDDADIIQAAASDIAQTGAAEGRKSWLAFCVGVKHAYAVRDALRGLGVIAETVTGDTDPGERRKIIADFKAGRVTCLTNAEVLTKGFDAPGVDIVAMLRPTLSPGLLIQIIGRGTRPIYPAGFNPNDATIAERRQAIADGPKPNCRVLDYSGNITRHGPIDTITVAPAKRRVKGETDPDTVKPDDVRAKECPDCKGLQPIARMTCKDCGYEWPTEAAPNHAAEAEDVAVLSRDLPKVSVLDEVPVMTWRAVVHHKMGAPSSMKVLYSAGLAEYPEWWTFEHGGRIADKARRLWTLHGGVEPAPKTSAEGVARFGELQRPAFITTKKNGKWFDITGRRFNQVTEDAA